VVVKIRERWAVDKQAAKKFDVDLRKQWELEFRKQYQNIRFTALENFNDSKNISRAWGNIKENVKTSAKDSPSLYESKQN
jgi:hypothetical protein